MARIREARRCRHDIIVEILENAKNGVRKSPLMRRSRLSFHQVEAYLKLLSDLQLLREEREIWKTTDRGVELIKVCHCIREFAIPE